MVDGRRQSLTSPAPLDGPGGSENGNRPPFRRDVQGLRAVAVVLVVLFHAGFGFPGGFLGVDVFFVISGFVIARLLVAEQDRHGRIALGRFYARRVRRLFPALAAMLVVVAVLSPILLSPLGSLRETVAKIGAGAALYVGNFAVLVFQENDYFALDATANPLVHTWTLGVEEQFYLFLPLLLIAAVWLGRNRRRGDHRMLAVSVTVVAVLSFLAGAVLSGAFGHHGGIWTTRGRFAFYASITRAWEFLAGVLVALAEPVGRRLPARFAQIAVASGVAAIVVSSLVMSGTTTTPGPATLVPVVGTAVAILAGANITGWLRWILESRPVVWIGDRSYGWYLWHWPVIVFVATSFPTASSWVLLGAAVAALVPTAVSYRYLEQPVRLNPRWLGRRAVGLAVGCSALGVVAFVGLAAVPHIDNAGTRDVERSLAIRGPLPTSCTEFEYRNDPRRPMGCTWAVENPRGWVVLVGDSVANTLAAPLADRVNRAGYNLNMLVLHGCPFADVKRVYEDPDIEAGCRKFVTDAMDGIEATRPALVVLSSRQDAYVHLDSFTLEDPVTGAVGGDEAAKSRMWEAGLTRTLEGLSGWEIPGVVVATVPQLAPFNIELCPAWRLWSNAPGCARTLQRTAVDDYRRAGLEATTTAVDAVPGMTLVDFADELCESESCSTYRDGDWIYGDSTHLSPLGADRLKPAIGDRIVSRLPG